MFLLSSLTNEDSYNTKLYTVLRIQYSETVPGIPGFGTGSGTLEPVPWDRFLRQITTANRATAILSVRLPECNCNCN